MRVYLKPEEKNTKRNVKLVVFKGVLNPNFRPFSFELKKN